MDKLNIKITVVGQSDEVHDKAVKLCVGSWAPIFNPEGWKDLWRLSPLSIVEGGIKVPGLEGVRSKTVENTWQFLKVWLGEDKWCAIDAYAAFDSDCAIRYPRGKHIKAIGHYWGQTNNVIDYISARKKIYIPAYIEMLEKSDRIEVIQRLRDLSLQQPVAIWDPDSYNIFNYGLENIVDAVRFIEKPFAHAFVVALAIENKLDAILKD